MIISSRGQPPRRSWGSFLPELKSGLMSAPWVPQALQTNLSSRSDNLTCPGHRSPLIVVEWLQ